MKDEILTRVQQLILNIFLIYLRSSMKNGKNITVVVKKKTDTPRQDHSHKISSIFKIHSTVGQLEKLFYQFLWNSGPDRIRCNVII